MSQTMIGCNINGVFTCVLLADHGPPPATPTDKATYIAHSIGVYRLNLNFTRAPLGTLYIVRLITNATNTISHFLVIIPLVHTYICDTLAFIAVILVGISMYNNTYVCMYVCMYVCIYVHTYGTDLM